MRSHPEAIAALPYPSHHSAFKRRHTRMRSQPEAIAAGRTQVSTPPLSERHRPSSNHQFIAEPVHRQNVLWLVGVLFDFAPQLDDEVVDGAVGGIGVHAPDLVEDLFTAHGLSSALV